MNTHRESAGVVVATDGSPASAAAVDWAADEAAARNERLIIMTACQPVEIPASAAQESVGASMMSSVLDQARMRRKEHREIVAYAADSVRRRYPQLVTRTRVFEGDPRKALERYEKVASVVVLGSRGLGAVRSVLLGSVSFWASRHLSVPTVIVRPADTERLAAPEGIVVGIGLAPGPQNALRAAFVMAQHRGCPLTVGHAQWDSEAPGRGWTELDPAMVDGPRRRMLTEMVEKIASDYPEVSYRLLFARGRADSFLAELGHTHEAVVIGRRQPTLLDFVGLGTIASAVVEHAVGATVIIPEGEPSP